MKPLYTAAIACAFCLVIAPGPAYAQLTINDSIAVDDLVQDFFNSGVLVSISNVTVNGQPAENMVHPQFGLFGDGLTDGFDMNSGFAMYTESVANLTGGFGGQPMTENYHDADMATMTGNNVNDCAVVEFDVQADADALAFNYTFGSAEYAGYTCSQFNDGFGLFISGPGIEGPYNNNAVNIATIPDSDTPVAINTLNSGSATGFNDESLCEMANPNWQEDTIYFVNNEGNQNSSTGFSGYTVALEAYVEIEFGQTYHMKFAVCDVLDGALNSGVLLEEGSFEGRLLSSVRNSQQAPFKVYPNPAPGMLYLRNIPDGAERADFVDLSGRLVKSMDLASTPHSTVSVADLDAGVYIVEVWGVEGRLDTSKLVKK